MRKILLILYLISCSLPFSRSLSGQRIHFNHYKVEEGLAQSVVMAIYQDSEGYMWFGTQNGLSLFNGYEFLNFFTNPGIPNSLSNSWIYDISETTNGDIYIATKGGLSKYDKKSSYFSTINFKNTENIIEDNLIYGIAARENFLYINAPPSLIILNTTTNESEVYLNNYPSDAAIYDLGSDILVAKNNMLWIASSKGLSSFNLQTKKFKNYSIEQSGESRATNREVTALYEEKNGDILVATNNSLYLIRYGKEKLIPLENIQSRLNNTLIRAISRDKNENLWIATEGGGLSKLFIDKNYDVINIQTFLSDKGFISHNITYSLFIDKSDNLWLGTLGIDKADLKKSGINIIARTDGPESFAILDNVISSVYKDHSGRLWIGNWGTGLNILTKNLDRENIVHFKSEYSGKRYIPENHVHVIFEDSKKRVFLGTRNGVSVFDNESGSFKPAHEFFNNPEYNCFTNNRVYCMMEDHLGKIWIGTGEGIIILDIHSNTIQKIKSGDTSDIKINSNLIYSIMEDSENEIWIASSQGLSTYNQEQKTSRSYTNNPNSSNSICNNFIISLCEDKLGHIWIGTGSGLNRFSKRDSSFIYYSRADGLPSEIIYNILEDNNKNLWFSTGRGLAMINPDHAEKKKFTIIDLLKGEEFNLKAVFKSPDGELFFGGMNGLISFYPDSIRKSKFIPNIKITSIKKENDGIIETLNTYQEEITLSYKDYAFSIEFAALDFTYSAKNRYSYQMEGISDNWVNIETRRFVHFTNLPPGSYTFRVKGSNNDGTWNEKAESLKIIIKPPWWLSKYAYLGYLFLLIFTIIFIINIREKKLRREKKNLEEKVDHRTTEIAKQKQNAEDSEQKLRSTINSIDDLVFVLDEKGILQEFYNPRLRKTHLIFPELHLGKHYKDVNFPSEVISQLEQAFTILIEKETIREFDHHFIDNGNIYWYNTKISPKKNPKGKLTGFVIVARDITDRKQAEEKLARQKEKLNELNITKDKFFSILAHDLKNPFTNLYSMGDLLVKNYYTLEEEEKLEGLKKMHQASEFIYELLENLLTWSRTQRGKIDFKPVLFDLSTLVKININLHKINAEDKGLIIENKVNDKLYAYADREMINTIIRNLINNSVKFTSRGGKISIAAELKKDSIIVSIADQGVGISAENLKKLFGLDDKHKTRGTSGETGTGLGLVLCKEFIEKNGGQIWCESELNTGSVFYFAIPVQN